MVQCGEECILPRPFSIHRVDNSEDIILYFAALENGKGTGWLSRREVGDEVELTGPIGKGPFSIHPTTHNLLLVAGGMGIASLYFLAAETSRKGYSVKTLYGGAKQNPYVEGLFSSNRELVVATEDGSAGHKGLITELLPGYIDWADQVFACGPLPMYRAMAQMPELEKKPAQVSLEIIMGCGRGVCYGCGIKTRRGLKLICQDGPIFNLDDILWDELS